MLATITTTSHRMGGVTAMVLILLSFVCHPDVLHQQAPQLSLPVPPSSTSRAPIVEPDPRKDNIVPGLTTQVTIDAPVPQSHHGHDHHE